MNQTMILDEALRIREPMAIFGGERRQYRWFLAAPTKCPNDRALLAVMANPSKAGSRDSSGTFQSDPTVSRMRGLAQELGYGWLWVVNCRSYIATDPRDVPADPEAIGDLTDWYIRDSAKRAALVVMAYGHLAGERGRVATKLVREVGKVPHALALTASGIPRHPRGVPKTAMPFPMVKP
jgi:hypothetical protein